MTKLFTIIQIVSAIALIIAILLQQRGTGLGSAFGGDSAVFRTKRGVEKTLFFGTIIFSILFFASIVAGIIWP